MALRIVDGGELSVRNLVTVIYGLPNHGKTTLALTAEEPLLLDFDSGAYRAGNRHGKRVVEVASWQDVEDMDKSDLDGCQTVIVDTLGSCLERLAEDIMQRDDRMRRGAGQLSLQGFGALKGRFNGWLTMLKGWGVDVILVAHQLEVDRGGETADRLDAQGGSRDMAQQKSDLIGRVYIDGSRRRFVTFEPTSTSLGKNVGLYNEDNRPDFRLLSPAKNTPYMAQFLSKAKELINQQAEDQAAEVHRLLELREGIEALDPFDADPWNAQLLAMEQGEAKRTDKAVLWEIAKARGLTFEEGAFVAATRPEPAESPGVGEDAAELEGAADAVPF